MCEHWTNGVSPWPGCKDCRVEPLPEPCGNWRPLYPKLDGGASPKPKLPGPAMPEWSEHDARKVLSAVFGKLAEVVFKQCRKQARRTKSSHKRMHDLQEYVSVVALWALDPDLGKNKWPGMTKGKVSTSVRNAIYDAERKECITRLTAMHKRKDGKGMEDDLDYGLVSTIAEGEDRESLFDYLTAGVAEREDRESLGDPAGLVGRVEIIGPLTSRKAKIQQVKQKLLGNDKTAMDFIAYEYVKVDGKTYRYAAEALDIGLGTAHNAVRRIQARLEAMLGQLARPKHGQHHSDTHSLSGGIWYGSQPWCLPLLPPGAYQRHICENGWRCRSEHTNPVKVKPRAVL